MCVHEFTGQAILPENVQRQKEAVEVVVEEEATSVTAVTGYLIASFLQLHNTESMAKLLG